VETAFTRQPHHTRKQFEAIRATPLWILIGKVNPDISFTKRAKNGIGNRMRERIRIRVPVRAAIGSYSDTSEYKLTPFNEPVRISANPNP
jgi:hypothetical protein